MSESAALVRARETPAASEASAVDVGFVVALLFFVSGGASLLLETAAVRAFLELFGSTAASLGAVGGAFLVCLALGAFLIGSRADRTERPLRLYALLEATACVGALAVLLLLPRLDGLATSLAAAEARGESTLLSRLLACSGVLLVPVGALGATLPVLARVRERSRSRGAAAGGLQAASTFGGMAGALLASTVLLGALGTRGTWMLAAGLNGFVALGAAILARRGATSASEATARDARDESAAAATTGADTATTPAAPLLIASLLTGFSVLALEVLLFRGLGQAARGSQDTLGVLLAAFLGASALGSAIGVLLARRGARTGFVVGQALSFVAPLAALACLRAISQASPNDAWYFGAAALTRVGRLTLEALGALLVAGPSAFATAIAFPCACELARAPRFGRLVALLSGAWTAGAALAGVVTPLLLPRLGLRGALLGVAALPLVGLAVVALGDRTVAAGRRLTWVGAALVVGLAAVFFAPGRWDAPLVFFHRVAGGPGSQVLDYREDAIANVAVVRRSDGERVLGMNDQLALGGSDAARVEMTQGALPALLHPGPKRALALGVGTGGTLAGLRQVGCPQVDAVELIPSVLSMLPWFAAENGGIVLDRNVHLVATDARAFVRTAEPESYDLIVGDLFFPWEAEAGLLYTREHFERVKRLLAPGGIFCQWIPGHQLRWEEIGLVGRTFCDVFDGATVWLASADFPFPLLGLIGSTERLELDVPKLSQRLEQHPSKELLQRLGIAQAKDLLALYVADEWFFGEKFEGKGINTADRARVEFSAAGRVESDNVVALINRRRLFESHEDVVYRMTQPSIDKRKLVELKRELSGAAQAMWKLFDARTKLLYASANRELPVASRRNSPEELEGDAFGTLGAMMRDRPDYAPAAELMWQLLGQWLRQRDYGRIVDATLKLEAEPGIGSLPRLRYLRGLAFLHAVCDPDPQQAALFTKPLDFAIKDLRKAVELDPKLVEANVHLGIALFVEGSADAKAEARALLQSAREKIVAPDRPDGHGLPPPAEAVLAFLNGEPDAAQQWLARPESQRFAAKIAEAMKKGAP